ncbi:MAG: hypothetical protein V7L25_27600 [Nostoc sp.]
MASTETQGSEDGLRNSKSKYPQQRSKTRPKLLPIHGMLVDD